MDNYELRIVDIINRYKSFMVLNNIIGVGLGTKIINGNKTNIPSLTFFVPKKLANSNLSKSKIIPKFFYGVLTDVIELEDSNNTFKERNININEAEDDFKAFMKSGDILCNQTNFYPGVMSASVTSKTSSLEKEFCLTTERVATGNLLGFVGDKIDRLSNFTQTAKKRNFGVLSKIGNIKIYRNEAEDIPATRIYNTLDMAVIYLNPTNYSETGIWNGDKVVKASTVKVNDNIVVCNRGGGRLPGVVTAIKSTIVISYVRGKKWAHFKDVIIANVPNLPEYSSGSLGLIKPPVAPKENRQVFDAFGILGGHLYNYKNPQVYFIPIQTISDQLTKWNMNLVLS